MAKILMIVLYIAILVYALSDLARTPEDEVPLRLPKLAWAAFIFLLNPIGGIAWIIMRAVSKAEAGGSGPLGGGDGTGNPLEGLFGGSRTAASQEPPAPVAPDDDPDFLFKLERDIRRQRMAQGANGDETIEGTSRDVPESDDDSDPQGGTDAPSDGDGSPKRGLY